MPSGLATVGKEHPDARARPPKVSRKQAEQAREKLAEGGLSHQERRKLRGVTAAREAAERRRRGGLRHFVIVAVGTIAVMAVVAAVTMPLTYSIATGIGLGFITYALIKLIAGRFADAKPAVLVLALIFAVKFALG